MVKYVFIIKEKGLNKYMLVPIGSNMRFLWTTKHSDELAL